MANNNQNQKIIFTEDPIDIILDILKKNGLEETIKDINNKIKKGETSRFSVISRAAKDIASGQIMDKNFFTLIGKQLATSEESAKKIIEDIKTKLVPLTTKIIVGENKIPAEESPSSFIKKAPDISVEENAEKMKKVPKKIKKTETEGVDEIPKEIKPPAMPKSSGPDAYREPIE